MIFYNRVQKTERMPGQRSGSIFSASKEEFSSIRDNETLYIFVKFYLVVKPFAAGFKGMFAPEAALTSLHKNGTKIVSKI